MSFGCAAEPAQEGLPVNEAAEFQQAEGASARWFLRIIEPRVLGPLVGAALVLIAVLVIHQISGEIHLTRIRNAISATPWQAVGLTALFTAISFCAMSLYDVMAVRQIAPGRVRPHFAAMAGMVGYAISNALGFHVLVGGPVRYRLYSAVGLDAATSAASSASPSSPSGSASWPLIGAAFLVDPVGVPLLDR